MDNKVAPHAHPALRVGAVVAGGFGLLLAVIVVTRPDAMGMAMSMTQRLIVGFGL